MCYKCVSNREIKLKMSGNKVTILQSRKVSSILIEFLDNLFHNRFAFLEEKKKVDIKMTNLIFLFFFK